MKDFIKKGINTVKTLNSMYDAVPSLGRFAIPLILGVIIAITGKAVVFLAAVLVGARAIGPHKDEEIVCKDEEIV